MKKLISLALAALLLLNLAACGESSVSNPSGSSGDSSSSADPAQPDAFSPVTTEAEVRALYGDDASLITSIEAYQGDFLVKLGTDEDCPSLDWVYGQSGIRRRMLWLDTPLLRCEIESQASVRVVTGGPNIYNGVPGILMAVMFMIYSYFFARKHGYPAEPKPTPKEVWTAFKVAAPTLLLPILIMGTILAGICTPTESAVLAVVYALFLSCVVYRTLPLRELKETFVHSAKSAAMVLVVIATASLLSWAVTVMNIPQMMADFVYSITDSPAVFLMIVNVLLVIAGMFLDAGSAIMILSPVLLPIALSLQIDPLAFGIIMVVNLSIGVLTPPVGLNLYVVSSLSNLDIMRVAKACMPFILMIFGMLIVCSFFPQILTFLPELLYG